MAFFPGAGYDFAAAPHAMAPAAASTFAPSARSAFSAPARRGEPPGAVDQRGGAHATTDSHTIPFFDFLGVGAT